MNSSSPTNIPSSSTISPSVAAWSSRRYVGITVSIVVFLLLIGGLLTINYFISARQAVITLQIDALGEMSDSSYDLLSVTQSSALSFGEEKADDGETVEAFDDAEIKEAVAYFSQLLTLLHEGGQYGEAGGGEETLQALTGSVAEQQLQVITTHRQKFEPYLHKLHASEAEVQQQSVLDFADYMAQTQPQIYEAINTILADLTEQSRLLSDRLRLFQAAGITLIVLYFLVFVFYFLRKMRLSDIALAQAHRETRDILDNVSDGFFLLDPDSRISSQYSRATEAILLRDTFVHKNFLDVVHEIFHTERVRDAVKLYLEQLYNPRVVEKLIQKLNPLRKVEAQIGDEDDSGSLKTLSFHFSRVIEDKKIQKILVNVRDITDVVRLEQQLETEREHNNEQAESMLRLMQTDRGLMQQFLQHAMQVLNNINNILKNTDNSSEQLREKARLIAREIHSIKGEASALQLSAITRRAESFESHANPLVNKEFLTGNDFLKLTVQLDELLDYVQLIHQWHTQISSSSVGISDSQTRTGANLSAWLSGFVQQVGERNHKKVRLFTCGLDQLPQNNDAFVVLKEIMIQLLRNAVIHGIETVAERQALGKEAEGMILCGVQVKGSSVQLMVQDDGQGVNFDVIRQKAVAKGLASEQEAAAWNNEACFKMLFHSGFSTLSDSNEDAGRGVGMDIIKNNVQKLDGHLSLKTVRDQLTRFTIYLPNFLQEETKDGSISLNDC